MVDFNKKILNTDKFRQAAIFYKEHGTYTLAPRGTTDYILYWELETLRCLYGYVAPDGDPISGYHYFYLNYFPILRLAEETYKDKYGVEKVRRVRKTEFADFYDYDYYYFNSVEEAEQTGKHMTVLKARNKGYSFKGASMLVRNYELIPASLNFAVASEQSFLTNDGLLTKAWDGMDFIDKNTAWAKQRLVDTKMKRTSGYKITDEFGKLVEAGYKSSIIGITLKNNPDRIRGTRGRLILWEEAGKFKDILQAWQIARPAVEEAGNAFGTMIAYGCVCKGTKVFTNDGDLKNIEDITFDDGILGWDTYQTVPLNISNINPPSLKECVEITTHTGKVLRCSKDHPLLWSKPSMTRRVPGGRATNERMKSFLWHEAGKCLVGELVGVIDEIPFFGKKEMWNPRLVGWLIGDGSYGIDKTPRLSNCDKEITEFVENNFDTAVEKLHTTKDGKNYKEIRIKGICKELRKLGIYGLTKDKKRLPNNVHQYNAESLSELIGGLFDTDGYIGVDGNNRIAINLTLCQKEILEEILYVLLHFGIHSTIRTIKPKYRKHYSNGRLVVDSSTYYRLEVTTVLSCNRFAKFITCSVGYKQAALDFIYTATAGEEGRAARYISGVRAERIVSIKDIGLLDIYNVTADGNNDYIANGIITHNTGGSEGADFDGLKEMFYHPDGYNVLSMPNIWDEKAEDGKCAFFVPSWTNLSAKTEDGERIYMDKDGNSLRDKAVQFQIDERNKVKDGASEQVTVDRYVAENCLTPQESILEIGGNIFPKKLLMQLLARIRTNTKLKNMKHIVDLSWSDGLVKAKEKKTGDITNYPLPKDHKPDGSVVIWEYPITDPPYGLYIAGCLTPGEKVCTQRGLVNVEDVTLDDKLVSKDGELVNIKNLQRYAKENERIFTIRTAGSVRTTTFTQEHPIYCGMPDKEFEFVKAKDVLTGLYTKIPNRYLGNGLFYELPEWVHMFDSDFWWFVGLWLGDGWSNKHKVYIAFDAKHISQIERAKRVVNRLFRRSSYTRNRGGSVELSFGHSELSSWLHSNFGKNADGKHVAEWAKESMSFKDRINLVLGYLDSDGYIGKNLYSEFVSINLLLLEDFLDILFSIGCTSSITKMRDAKQACIQGRIVNQKACYHLRACPSSTTNLCKLFRRYGDANDLKFAHVDLNKKCPPKHYGDIFFSSDFKYIYVKIKDIIESKYTGVVYNFECDTHTFMCRNIATHNCDPYDHDDSFTNSLGSTFIYKRFKAGEAWTDMLVAEYSGRPSTAEEYYENVRKLLTFYNARLLFENERKGIYPYFTNKHCDYLLADQPDKIITEVFKDSKVQRRKGCHMTKLIRLYGEGLILEWLLEEYEPGHMNLERIYSEPLIEELIANDGIRNVDRLIALCMVMIYREELYLVKVSAAKELNKLVELFELPLFGTKYWDADGDDEESPFNF